MNWPNILSLLERVLLMSHDDQFLLLSLAKDYAFAYLNKGLLDSLTHYINMQFILQMG
jgi:hypothetical protein